MTFHVYKRAISIALSSKRELAADYSPCSLQFRSNPSMPFYPQETHTPEHPSAMHSLVEHALYETVTCETNMLFACACIEDAILSSLTTSACLIILS